MEFELKILKPREQKIIDFLTKVQNYDFEFRTSKDTNEIKVISLYYYANSPLSFLFVQPCYEFYSDEKTIDRPEIHLEDYEFYDIEELGKKVLDVNEIDYSDLDKNDEFDLAEFWENKGELEKEFIISCWRKAKLKTQTTLIGFLDASDYSGGTYDLNNGYCLWDDRIEIREYLKKKGIIIKKEI